MTQYLRKTIAQFAAVLYFSEIGRNIGYVEVLLPGGYSAEQHRQVATLHNMSSTTKHRLYLEQFRTSMLYNRACILNYYYGKSEDSVQISV